MTDIHNSADDDRPRLLSKPAKRTIRVFIASPGGLEEARRAFKDTIDDLNRGFGDGCNVKFVALAWEDTLSPTGIRAQSEINKDVDACDVFLLVLDRVWGRRNKDAKLHALACLPGLTKMRPSNTMEEFSLALARFERTNHPQVFPVLKNLPAEVMRDPGVELKQVLKLRRLLAKSNYSLMHEWKTIEEFRNRTDAILRRVARGNGTQGGDAESPSPAPPFDPGPEFRKRLEDLEAELQKAKKKAADLARKLKFRGARKLIGSRADAIRKRDRTRKITENALAERCAVALAEKAAKAALAGKLEEARQDFAKALDGTSNLRVFYLAYSFFKRIGELGEAERLLNRWLAVSGPEAQTAETAAAYGNLSLIYHIRGDLDRAEEVLRKSLAIHEKLGSQEDMASGYGNLGLIYETRGDPDRAEKLQRKALAIHKKLGDLEGMAMDYGNLGLIYQAREDQDRAEQMHRKALAIDTKIGRLEGLAKDYSNLGLICWVREDLSQAEELQRKAMEIHEKLGHLVGSAANCANLGLIYRRRRDIPKARRVWLRARDLYAKVGMQPELAKVQSWLDHLSST